MDHTRREVCASLSAIVLGSTTVAGTVAAQSETVTVSGTVKSDAGTALAGNTIEFIDRESFRPTRAEVGTDGGFETELASGSAYDVTYFHHSPGRLIHPDFDSVPVIYALEEVHTEQGAVDLGTATIPRGVVTQIRIVDGDDNPLQNVPLSFSAPNNVGTGPSAFTTNERGYVTNVDASEPGIELAAEVVVRTHPPGGDGGEILGRVFASGDSEEFTFTLRNPDDYTNVIVRTDAETTGTPVPSGETPTTVPETSAGTPTPTPAPTASPDASRSSPAQSSEERQRGFFSNSGTGPDFLANPVNLTTAGFLLSVGGIAYQLVNGDS